MNACLMYRGESVQVQKRDEPLRTRQRRKSAQTFRANKLYNVPVNRHLWALVHRPASVHGRLGVFDIGFARAQCPKGKNFASRKSYAVSESGEVIGDTNIACIDIRMDRGLSELQGWCEPKSATA